MTDIHSFKFNDGTKAGMRKSLIFIRNTGMKDDFSFENCSYEEKAAWLLMYLQGDIDAQITPLRDTWIDILFGQGCHNERSIISGDDINRFIDENREYVSHVRQFINSLPLYAIFAYHRPNQEPMSMDQFEISDFHQINLINVGYLADHPGFIILLDNNPPDDQKPVFFKKIWTDEQNLYDLSAIMAKMPYINLISLMLMPADKQAEFVNNFDTYLKREEGSKDGSQGHQLPAQE